MRDNKRFVNKDLGVIDANNIDKFIKDHEIDTGKFKGVNVGNTFTISYDKKKKKIIIIGLDSMLGISTNEHHIVCMPIDDFGCFPIIRRKPNVKDDTFNFKAFAGSDMFNITLTEINKNLEIIFGKHLLVSRELLEDGNDSIKQYNCKSILLSEKEIFGKTISGKDYKEDKSEQLPFFKILENFLDKLLPCIWLRNKKKFSSVFYCYYCSDSFIHYDMEYHSHYVKPRFLLG